ARWLKTDAVHARTNRSEYAAQRRRSRAHHRRIAAGRISLHRRSRAIRGRLVGRTDAHFPDPAHARRRQSRNAGTRRDQVAEVLTFILVTAPLQLQIADQPIKLAEQQMASWEKLYGGVAETLELVGGVGRTWTNEEKLAGMANGRQLTQGGPPPQTVYRVARKTG